MTHPSLGAVRHPVDQMGSLKPESGDLPGASNSLEPPLANVGVADHPLRAAVSGAGAFISSDRENLQKGFWIGTGTITPENALVQEPTVIIR